MGSREILFDDFDGDEKDVTTRRFSVEDQVYEIDLSPANQQRLIEVLAPFVNRARKVSGSVRVRAAPARDRKYGDPELAKIRAWAQAQGFEVKPHGRIPKDVRTAYAAATNNH